jgi:hypothetical protein
LLSIVFWLQLFLQLFFAAVITHDSCKHCVKCIAAVVTRSDDTCLYTGEDSRAQLLLCQPSRGTEASDAVSMGVCPPNAVTSIQFSGCGCSGVVTEHSGACGRRLRDSSSGLPLHFVCLRQSCSQLHITTRTSGHEYAECACIAAAAVATTAYR